MTGTDRPPGEPTGTARYGKDPWAEAPTEELTDQVLPRWFVLLAIVAVVVAVGTFVTAFFEFGPREVPVAERRPPPADGLTHDVGGFVLGDSEAVPYADSCPLLEGVRVAGAEADRARLRSGLAALCNVAEADLAEALRAFAQAGGVVRFATFTDTGVASAATTGGDPQILVNARFSRTGPLRIAPLIAHDVVARTGPGDAATELSARIGEADVCARIFDEPPPSCTDAAALVELPDPLGALRDAGYR